MKVIALSADHVEAAAGVLADLHSHSAATRPVSTLSNHDVAIEAIQAVMERGLGVAVLDGSALLGYLVAPLPNAPGHPTTRLGSAHHAARVPYARPVYRLMYESIAGRLVTAGCTYHSFPVLVGVPALVDTFVELEFGFDQIKGALPIDQREVAAETAQSAAYAIRPATDADIDAVLELAIELTKYHSRAPMFQPALLDVRHIRDNALRALDNDAETILVADDGRRLLAMLQAGPDGAYTDSVVIGMNVVTESARSDGLGTAMLNALLTWARHRGYRYCTVSWTSSNLVSDTFYRSRGFTPIRYRLHRRIDPRVAWANETLDYDTFLS